MAWFDLDRALQGKALGAHPAFMGSDPVSVYSPGASRQDAALSQRNASRHLDGYGGDQAIDHVYDCINLYVDAIASSPYRLERADGTKLVRTKSKGTPPDHEVGPAEVYELLDEPNPHMLWDELVSLLIIDWMMVGNAYWFELSGGPSGRPLELYRLAPSHVKIIPGRFGPKRYDYQPPGVREKLEIQPENIIHFRRPNPHDAFYGMGIIQGAGRSMDMELAITDTISSYYENKADPSLVVTSERRVSRDVFNKLRAQMRARVSGSSKAGELLVLEAGLKADTLSASASDALFDKLGKMSRDRVLQKFHAHPMLLGQDSSSASNKVSDVRREFDNYTLRPFMTRLQTRITKALLKDQGLKLIIDYAQMLPPEEAIKVGESVGKIPGVKIREVRKQYAQFGIEESTGDADIDEELLNLPLGELGPDGQPLDPSVASGADKPLSSEPGRPPKPSNTHSLGNAAGKALVDLDVELPQVPYALQRARWTRSYLALRQQEWKDAQPRKSVGEVSAMLSMKALEAAADKAIARGKGLPSTPAPDNRLPDEQRPDDPFSAARTADINGTTADIARGLREAVVELERGLLDVTEGKALKTTDIVARMRKAAAWKVFEARVRDILREGGSSAAASGVMHTGLENVSVDYDEIAEDVLNRPEGVRGIVKTLKDRYASRLKAARSANAERTEYEAAIRSVSTEWADNQAVAIADSESTEAYNEGTLSAAEAAGVSRFYVVEEDDAPDKACRDAKGSVWDLAKARANRKEHPRCRRAFIPLPEAEVA